MMIGSRKKKILKKGTRHAYIANHATPTYVDDNSEEQPLTRVLGRPSLPETEVDPQLQQQEEAPESSNVAAPPPTFPPPMYPFRESELHSRRN